MALVRKREDDSCILERLEKKPRTDDVEYPFQLVYLRRVPIINTLPRDQVSLLLEKDVIDTMLDEEEIQCKKINYNTECVHFKKYFESYRGVVVSWMNDVVDETKLSLLTLHYAIWYLDRFIQVYPRFLKEKYQLVAVVCILIAGKNKESFNIVAKKEETDVPSLDLLIEYTANSWTKTEISKAEYVVLNALNWDLSCISPAHFLEYFSFFENKNETIQGNLISPESARRIQDFSKLFVEACLIESSMINRFVPSKVAAGSIYTARMVCGVDDVWPIWLQKKTGYNKNELEQCHDMLFTWYRRN